MAFKDDEIDALIEQDTRLPSTHREGYARGNARDDVAKGKDGKPVHVPTPETPDDRFGD